MGTNENAPFLDSKQAEELQPSTVMKLWDRFFGFFISVTVGIYAGLVLRTFQEVWIYATIFCSESLVCGCLAAVLKTYTFKKAITGFLCDFLISALITSASCCFKDHFGNS
jgi:hypothetical protein